MAMGRKPRERQESIWVATADLTTGPGHPFYSALNRVLKKVAFDEFVESVCAKFYKPDVVGGRPSIPPGVYFRMLIIGFFEGIDSERGIAWRCQDSLALREFLGYDLSRRTPNHSTLSVIRTRLDIEAHEQVFDFLLKALVKHKLVKGRTIGVDATTLEANAALRSIVRRGTGESYEEFLTALAKASGIETPTRDDLARIDRARKGKGSNKDWEHPHDPDARIAKMKDGRTHMAHKAEHAVDLDTGAILAVTIQAADRGDTQTVDETMKEAIETVSEIGGGKMAVKEAVMDRGYHSNDVLADMSEARIRTYVAEPKRGRRRWKDRPDARRAVHANRRRMRGKRGMSLGRRRSELVERTFAHLYETGRMRRTHLRGSRNIRKRVLVHAAAANLGLLMRKVFGVGTPRALQGGKNALAAAVLALWRLLQVIWALRVPADVGKRAQRAITPRQIARLA